MLNLMQMAWVVVRSFTPLIKCINDKKYSTLFCALHCVIYNVEMLLVQCVNITLPYFCVYLHITLLF